VGNSSSIAVRTNIANYLRDLASLHKYHTNEFRCRPFLLENTTTVLHAFPGFFLTVVYITAVFTTNEPCTIRTR